MRFKLGFILSFLLILFGQELSAQLSKTHYIPPFYAHNNGSGLIPEDQALYISTPHANASYTITDGAGTVIQSGSVQEGAHDLYLENGYGTPFIADAGDLNTVLTSKGVVITADSAIYVNLRLTTSSHAGSLTSKGIDAIGTTYRLGHIPTVAAHNQKCAGYGIMAVEDGTIVTINFKQQDIVFEGVGAPDPTVPLVINLDAGESYVGAIHTETNVNNLDTGLIGSLITSNKPIAVNTGSWAGSLANSTGADIGIDQIVDASLVGDRYVSVRGQGQDPDDDNNEQVMVVAHEDNTDIFVNGGTVPVATINAGEYHMLDGSNYIDEVMYITSSEKTYVYQLILGADNKAYTQGMNFVPPITCYSSREINSIPAVDSIGNTKYQGGVTVVTKKNSTILVNGAVPSVTAKAAVGSDYEAYKIEGLTGTVSVTTNTLALVGFFGYGGTAGYGGYYSGFDNVEFTNDIVGDCPPGVLYASSNIEGEYQWHLDDIPLDGEESDSLVFSDGGDYYVVFTRNDCKDTSAIINVIPNPEIDLGPDFTICEHEDTLIEVFPNDGDTVKWFGSIVSNSLTLDTAGVYRATVTNVNGCSATDSLEMFDFDCISHIQMPNVINPSGSDNYLFKPVEAHGILNPHLQIFNRWGVRIANLFNLGYGWDATINGGQRVSPGVYYYTLTYQSQTLTETIDHEINGFVHVL